MHVDEQQELRRAEVRRRTAVLRAWCARRGAGAKAYLARETGRTFAAIARIVKGDAQPSPETAAEIERATSGAVKATELLGLTEPTVVEPGEAA